MKIKIAYQGIPGSNSEQALEEFAKKLGIEIEGVGTEGYFKDLFEIINKETFTGLVPIENTTAGSVVECYDLLLEYDFEIIGEHTLDIKHCLLANKGTKPENITQIISHPQALAQCSNFIDKNRFKKINFDDTAGAGKYIKESKNPHHEWWGI